MLYFDWWNRSLMDSGHRRQQQEDGMLVIRLVLLFGVHAVTLCAFGAQYR